MRLLRVISGGQTGVDIAALRAAKALGIPTGGMMPRGWKTLDGPRPEYADLYGMQEATSSDYSARTAANVTDSHATLRIASRWDSPGEICTLRWLVNTQRPFFDVGLDRDLSCPERLLDLAEVWLLRRGGDVVLNVAGNSEMMAPGIEDAAELILRRVFASVAREQR